MGLFGWISVSLGWDLGIAKELSIMPNIKAMGFSCQQTKNCFKSLAVLTV